MGVRAGDLRWTVVRGPLAVYARGFAVQLSEQGYRWPSIRRHVQMMGRLSEWMEGRGLSAGGLTAECVAQFTEIMHATMRGSMPVCGLASSLSFLRDHGAVPVITPERTEHSVLFALSAAGELCVGDLALALEVTEDQISYALKMLRLAGLVGFRKDGRMSFYRLSGGFPHQLLEHCLRQLIAIASPEAGDART